MSVIDFNNRASEYRLSSKDYNSICKLVYDATGIVLDERKQEMVYRRLMRRTRDLKLPSFKTYFTMLHDGNGDEFPSFINAITTNLTSFFRESHHFEYLRETFLPEHLKQFSHTKKLRIWSAACSTGEEPYSLAITLMQSMQGLIGDWDVKILATDLDTDVIATAKAGVYKAERIKGLESSMKSWFKKGTGKSSNFVKVDPRLANLITFKPLNLLHDWPMRGPFDVIICRNVLIYFDKPTQTKLIQRYHQMLRPGGVLILGHSERMSSMSKGQQIFEMKGRTVFKKFANSQTREFM